MAPPPARGCFVFSRSWPRSLVGTGDGIPGMWPGNGDRRGPRASGPCGMTPRLRRHGIPTASLPASALLLLPARCPVPVPAPRLLQARLRRTGRAALLVPEVQAHLLLADLPARLPPKEHANQSRRLRPDGLEGDAEAVGTPA